MHSRFDSTQNMPDSAQAILESITDGFFSVNGDWKFTYMNRQAATLLDRVPAEMLGKDLWECYPPLIGSDFETLYRETASKQVPGTITSFYPDHGKWYEVRTYPASPAGSGISVYFRDVTERVHAEERLRDSELRFRLLADAIPQIVWITDGDGRAIFFNKQWTAYTGTAIGTMDAERVMEAYVHPDDFATTLQEWNAARREGRAFNVEHRIRSEAGTYRWFLVRAEPWHDAGTGEISRWFGTSTDVHDRKLAEAALRKSESRYRSLFESIDEGFCIIEMIFDRDGNPCDYRFCETNPMFEQQSGIRDAVGKTMRAIAPKHEQHWFDVYGQVSQSGESVRFENEAKALGRWFDVYAFRLDDAPTSRVAVLFKDITERRRMEHELALKVRDLQEAKRRQGFQLAFADRLRPLGDPDQVAAVSNELLGKYLGAMRIDLLEVDGDGNSISVKHDWTHAGQTPMTGNKLLLSDFGKDLAQALRAGRVLSIGDVDTDARTAAYAEAFRHFGARSALAIPLMKSGDLRAVLLIQHDAARQWSEQDVMLAEDVVERTWAAVERARAEAQRQQAEEELLRSAERHAFRLQIADLLRGLTDVEQIFCRTSEALGRYFHACRVLYGDYDIRSGTITFHSNYTDDGVTELRGTFPADSFGADNFASLESGTTWVSHDMQHDQRTSAPGVWPMFAALRIYSGVVVPLNRRGALMACLFVNASRAREWSHQEVSLIEDVADRVWTAVERVRSLQEQRRAEEKLHEASRRKDEFLAMLAHELRNPLAPIGAAAELLKRARLDEARVRQTSEIIGRQVDHMTSLIDDLLDVSRVTRGLIKLDRTPLMLQRIVMDAMEQVNPLIQSRNHRLHLSLSPGTAMVLGDNKRLVQVVANLLNNAAKYTPEGGNITLRTALAGDEAVLTVADDGIGMEPDLVDRAFELFAQAERSSDRAMGGLGLGLALVKSLVELHGGTVTCCSGGAGKGSTFEVRLPRLPSDAGLDIKRQDDEHNSPGARPLRLMVVDDNVDAAQTLAMFLRASGHEVLVEHESLRALERARIEEPDACLLDIGLSGIDGNELARRLRDQSETAAAVLIAVTGYGQEHDRQAATDAGFDHYLVKPVNTARLAGLLAGIGAA